MASAESLLDRMQTRQLARFERMGLSARPMPDGRCLLVSLPFGPAPIETISGSIVPGRVVFSTVGPDNIKCLRPRSLFGLPLIDIRRCADAASIEWAIRQAWRDRTRDLRESAKALGELGLNVRAAEAGSALALPVPGESPNVQVLMHCLGEAILPSTGPLSGLPLDGLKERVLDASECLDSGADLEVLLGQRIEELQVTARERQAGERVRRQLEEPAQVGPRKKPSTVASRHEPKVLLVGPHLVADANLRAEFQRRGFRTSTSRSESEALVRLAGMSPDVVVSQYVLGRSDGASLVQAMFGLPGIERIPVVLLDQDRHEGRRKVARAVGAAGYLVEPLEIERFVARLGGLIETPPDRRFTRYPQKLAARIGGAGRPCLATEVGRGGVFVATPEAVDAHTAMHCEIALPELGRTLSFEAEVLYCTDSQLGTRQGLGLQIFEISPEDEAALIEYLGRLESKP